MLQIRLGTREYRVCKLAFANIHGISRKRVELIARYLSNDVTTPPEKRGKHDTRLNRKSAAAVAQVHEHILSVPRRSSHYSRRDNIKRYYLSPELSISKLYELYLERYEPDARKPSDNDNINKPKAVISGDFYYRYFKANFNYSFAAPRSDTCQTCDHMQNIITFRNWIHKRKLCYRPTRINTFR